MKPFRFLADIGPVVEAGTLAARARHAERLGYSTLVQPDHLLDQLSPVPALATVLAATERLRVSAFVFNNDLRHPAVLAQDLATLDILGGGRVDVAIGGGWNRREYDAVGLSFDATEVRAERLGEAIRVLKGAFAEGPFTFHGHHYTITDYDGRPKPVQRPHPPFFIGGGGRRTLEIAAREADIVGLAPRIRRDGRGDPASATLAATAEKIGWVRAAAGGRFDELELNVYPSMWPVTVTDDVRSVARTIIDRLSARTGVALTEAEVLESPHLFVGSVAGIVDKLEMLRERLGISSFMLGGIDELSPVVERLAGR